MHEQTPVASAIVSISLAAAVATGTILIVGHGAHADACLTRPNLQAAGGHWYYRVDRPTGRHCWYQQSMQAAPRTTTTAAPTTTRPTSNPVASLLNAVASLVGGSSASTPEPRTALRSQYTVEEPSSEPVVRRRWSRIARHGDSQKPVIARDASDSRAEAVTEVAVRETSASRAALSPPRPSSASAEPPQSTPADSNSREDLFREFLRFQDRWNGLFR